MSRWVAISFGALEVTPETFNVSQQVEILVTPVIPARPRLLVGRGADLWRRLVAGPVDISSLDELDQQVLEEMAEFGIASADVSHPHRVTQIPAPWLTSTLHELVYALINNVAAQHGIDLLFLKGPTLHAQGLRDRAHSGDVDCLVRPSQGVDLARALQPWGWSPAISAFTGTRVLHSLTLRAADWACAIDVHTWFPGITVDPEAAFIALEQHSETRQFAGSIARTPAREAHAAILALHEARPVDGHGPSTAKVHSAADALRAAGIESLKFVRMVGAEYALADAVTVAFPVAEFSAEDATVPPDWAWRLARTRKAAYLAALRIVPARQRFKVIWRILWPSPESLQTGPVAELYPSASVARLRLKRLTLAFRR